MSDTSDTTDPQAHRDAAFDECAAGDGPDTIVLPAGTYVLSLPDGPNGADVELDLECPEQRLELHLRESAAELQQLRCPCRQLRRESGPSDRCLVPLGMNDARQIPYVPSSVGIPETKRGAVELPTLNI